MQDIQQIALNKLVNVLHGMNAQYKIVFPDGTQMGNLPEAKVAKVKATRRKPSKYPHGTLTAYFSPFVNKLGIGETVSIPTGKFDPETIRTAMSGWICRTWGVQSAITTISRKNNTVEVLRLA